MSSMLAKWAFGFNALFLTAASAHGQLYVVTGARTTNIDINDYAFNLFRLDEGKLQRAAHIADGASWIGVSWDWRKMVILANSPEEIKVLDFDKAATVKACPDPPGPTGGLVDEWLLDSPSKGPVFVEELLGGDPHHPQLRGMVLDSSVPCNGSFASIDPSEARFYAGSGVAGIWEIGGVNPSMRTLILTAGCPFLSPPAWKVISQAYPKRSLRKNFLPYRGDLLRGFLRTISRRWSLSFSMERISVANTSSFGNETKNGGVYTCRLIRRSEHLALSRLS